jgi:glycosyltransferase involved in cell wall biosynthesis
MKVSVVIPAYNESSYLREAMGSALAQTHTELEVLVIDDGSTDDTRLVCESFGDPRVRYVYQANDGTRGLGARNAGMLLAAGEWIALLDQDDRWAPDKLEKQLRRAALDPRVGAVFCRVRFIDRSGAVTSVQEDVLPEGEAAFHELLHRNRYYVATGLFQRSLLSVAGVPDESSGFADWALWVGIARHTRVAVVQEPLADYREHAGSFLGQLSGPGELRKLSVHLQTLDRNALRSHPDCASCQDAVHRGRVETAKWILRIARRTLRSGRMDSVLAALGLAWRAAPYWLGRPWVFLVEALRLVLSALAGGVAWVSGRASHPQR